MDGRDCEYMSPRLEYVRVNIPPLGLGRWSCLTLVLVTRCKIHYDYLRSYRDRGTYHPTYNI
jgi:hypothetical protein